MRRIRSLSDLSEYGFEFLTGEACAHAYRVLCDVYPRGLAASSGLFGGTVDLKAAPWNNREIRGQRPVASILLPFELVLPLGVFCLLNEDWPHVFLAVPNPREKQRFDYGGAYAFGRDEEQELAERRELLAKDGWHLRAFAGRGRPGTEGDRCVHQMSGRVV